MMIAGDPVASLVRALLRAHHNSEGTHGVAPAVAWKLLQDELHQVMKDLSWHSNEAMACLASVALIMEDVEEEFGVWLLLLYRLQVLESFVDLSGTGTDK